MDIPSGRGASKANFFKGKYETKLEFQGSNKKKTSVGGYGYFLVQRNNRLLISLFKHSLNHHISADPQCCGHSLRQFHRANGCRTS